MENNYTYMQDASEKKGSVIGGFIGALIGALIGAALWAVIGMLGYIASIVGFVIAALASKGYDLLKGRQGTIKMIILIICVVVAVAVGTLGTYVWSIHNEYNEQLAALTDFEKKYYEITPEDEFILEILADEEVQSGMLKDSGMGLVFGILGSIGLIKAAGKKETKHAAPATEGPAVDEIASDEENLSL